MDPYPHQQDFLDKNPNKAILAWEMRVGKSLPASIWIDHPVRTGNTYIISPKQIKKDWVKMDTKATVLSKEEFKKAWNNSEIEKPTAIVVDEAHYFASPLFVKGRSQMAAALYELVREYPNCHILLLTATPIRQNAWSLHTLLCYIGEYYDWKDWRKEFFNLEDATFIKHRPGKWNPTKIWMSHPKWRTNVRKYLEKHCDIVSLKDIVEYLPPQESKIITVKQKPYERPTDEIVTWTHEHQYEQTDKYKEILKLGYNKLIVVVHYTDQIDELSAILSEEKPVFVLDGRTKDADDIKRQAQEAEECYFIVQASMGFGFDGYMFGAIVFASMSHSCVYHTQMTGRTRHLKHLRPVTNYYLVGGRWDKRIYDTIEAGKDFNPHIYRHEDAIIEGNDTPGTPQAEQTEGSRLWYQA